MKRALCFLAGLFVVTISASLAEEDSQFKHHRHGHHHHLHRSSSSSSVPCCHPPHHGWHNPCVCSLERAKAEVREASQLYLDLMIARDFAGAALLQAPDMPDPRTISQCPVDPAICCDLGAANSPIVLFNSTLPYQPSPIGHVYETGQYLTVRPQVYFYVDPVLSLPMLAQMTWGWLGNNCALRLLRFDLVDFRCNPNRLPTAKCIDVCPL